MALPHENLVVWQRSDDLFIELHHLTLQRFPAHERYELGSQIRRAAWSVPSNIVEGIGRSSRRDALRFFDISAASLREVGYGIHAARRLGYLDDAQAADLQEKLRLVGGPLRGLIASYSWRGGLVKGAGVLLAALIAGALL